MFVVTETILGREIKRNTASRAKIIAIDAVAGLTRDDCEFGKWVRQILRWDGRAQLRIRKGRDFVNLEER